MNEKNKVIQNFAGELMNSSSAIMTCLNSLCDNAEINNGIIKSAYVLVTAVNSNLTLLQQALDKYKEV